MKSEKKDKLVCIDSYNCNAVEVFDDLKKVLKHFGIYLTNSAACEGSDQLVFYITNYKLSKKELKELDEAYGLEPFDV